MTPSPPTRSQRAAQVLAGSLVFVVIGAVANVLQIFSFGTGWDLPDIIERLRPPATTAPVVPPATRTPASKKPTAKASSAAPTGKPKARTTSTRPPQTSDPQRLTVPSDAQIKNCLEQRTGWDTAQEAYGVTEADLGDRVTVRIKVSPADKAYTFWQTDEDCALRAVVRVSPGQSRTITTWGGALWDLARGSADPRVDGPGPISRPRSADLFTFEVGSTTVRYSF